MRYEELTGPLTGWTYDENGIIYTSTGYKTTARQIEFCMWMYDVMTGEARHWMIRSDERPGATRPLFDPNDLNAGSAGKDRDRRKTPRKARQRDRSKPGHDRWLGDAPSSRSRPAAAGAANQRPPAMTDSGGV
jgi:hypothetical protein